MTKKTLLILLLFSLRLFAFFEEDETPEATLKVPKAMRQVNVRVTAPRRSDVAVGFTVQGRVEPALTVALNARSEGIFYPVVALSQPVSRGEKIGELRDPARTLQIDALKDKVRLLGSQWAIERKKTAQSKEMLKLGILSENAVLAQESVRNEKEMLLLQARNDLARLQLLQKAQVITAPSNGFVKTLAAAGSYIAYGAQVATMSSKEMMVRLFVEPLYAESLKAGQKVTLMLSNREVPATLTAVLPQSSGNLIDVIARPSVPLPAGLALSARISTDAARGWIIPKSAIVLEQNRPAVFLVKGTTARLRFVTVQKDMLDEVLVSDPLGADDAVVSDNAYLLHDGERVEVVK